MSFFQPFADTRRSMGGGIVLRRHAGDSLEETMEIARAELDCIRQIRPRRTFLALLNEAAYFCNNRGIFCIDRKTIRIATLAGSKASGLRSFQSVMEPDVLRVCCPRRTRGSAIDPGSYDGEPELSVDCPVACDDTRPARIIDDGRHSGRFLMFQVIGHF